VAIVHRLEVDPVACDAFGYCAELLPELIWLDEWGYPVIDRQDIPPVWLELAAQAVRACPRKALAVRRASVPVAVPVGRSRAPRPLQGRPRSKVARTAARARGHRK
jgi:ferredoxin